MWTKSLWVILQYMRIQYHQCQNTELGCVHTAGLDAEFRLTAQIRFFVWLFTLHLRMWPVYGLLCEQLMLLKWPAYAVDHWWYHAHRPRHNGVYGSDHGNDNRYCRTVWLNAKNSVWRQHERETHAFQQVVMLTRHTWYFSCWKKSII